MDKAYSDVANTSTSAGPPKPGLLGGHVHEGDDAAGCPANHGLIAWTEIEVFHAIIAVRMSRRLLRKLIQV